MAEKKCIPAIQHVKMSDGSFAAVFPVTTTNEVYYDIDAGIKLEDYQNAIMRDADFSLETEDELLTIGTTLHPEAAVGNTIYVSSNNTKYIITNTEKFGSMGAFSVIPNSESGSVEPIPNRVAKFDDNSRLHSAKPVHGNEVATYEFLLDEGFTKGVDVEDMHEITDIDASTLNGLPASRFLRMSQIEDVVTIEGDKIVSVDASKLCDMVPVECLPAEAFQKCVKVSTDDERFKLTKATVHNGDTVKVENPIGMYFVTDDNNLDNESGYTEYSVKTASKVSWFGVTDKPTTIAGYGLNRPENALTKVLVDDGQNKSIRKIKLADFDFSNIGDNGSFNANGDKITIEVSGSGSFYLGKSGDKIRNLSFTFKCEDPKESYYEMNGTVIYAKDINDVIDISDLELNGSIKFYIFGTGTITMYTGIMYCESYTIETDKDFGLISSDTLKKIETLPGKMDINTHGEVFNDYENNVASGYYSHAGGKNSKALHAGTFVHGEGLESSTENQTVVGRYNNTDTDALFVVGSGGYNKETGELVKKNAIEVGDDVTNVNTNMMVSGPITVKEQKSFDDVEFNEVVTRNAFNNLSFNSLHMDINKLTYDQIQHITKIGLAPLLLREGDILNVDNTAGYDTRFKITKISNDTDGHYIELENVKPFGIGPCLVSTAFIKVKSGKILPKGNYCIRGGVIFKTRGLDYQFVNPYTPSSDEPGDEFLVYSGNNFYSFTIPNDLPENYILTFVQVYGDSDQYFYVYENNESVTVIDKIKIHNTGSSTKPDNTTLISDSDGGSNNSDYINTFEYAYIYGGHIDHRWTYGIGSDSCIKIFANGYQDETSYPVQPDIESFGDERYVWHTLNNEITSNSPSLKDAIDPEFYNILSLAREAGATNTFTFKFMPILRKYTGEISEDPNSHGALWVPYNYRVRIG